MSFLDFIDPGNSGGSVPTQESPWDGLPPPAPAVYRCSVCDATFSDTDRLFEHRFSEHPYKRPALILDGHELTSPREIVVRPLVADQIALAHTDYCVFNDHTIRPEDLADLLSKQREGLHTVVLEKLGIETYYEIDFEIAKSSELLAVDRLFLSIVGAETLTLDRINLFIEMADRYTSARRYVDGLCQYLYGVLAKDQRGGTHLPQSDYKTKFNLALNSLQLFERPLADVVVGVVNFSQNAFNDGDRLGASPKLQKAMRVFFGFLNGVGFKTSLPWSGAGMCNVPVDQATDQIVQWAIESDDELLRYKRQMESIISGAEWVSYDRFKVSMLLAEKLALHGDITAAQGYARQAVNDALFGEWAQRIMESEANK